MISFPLRAQSRQASCFERDLLCSALRPVPHSFAQSKGLVALVGSTRKYGRRLLDCIAVGAVVLLVDLWHYVAQIIYVVPLALTSRPFCYIAQFDLHWIKHGVALSRHVSRYRHAESFSQTKRSVSRLCNYSCMKL